MGMAASQARFLGLTARKTNVEYEGQQVNQQRTALSNQSANYYNQLLGMQVPVPPSIQDYTKTVYSFTDGGLSNTVTSMIAKEGGKYLISYLRTYNDPSAVVATPSSIVTRSGKGIPGDPYKYSVGAKKIRQLSKYDESGTMVTDSTITYVKGGESKYTGDDEYLKSLSGTQLTKLIEEEAAYTEKLNKKYCKDGTDGNWQVYYRLDSTSGTYNPVFYKQNVLDKATYSSQTGASQSFIQAYTTGQEKVTEEVKGVEAKFEQDSSGRLISITLNPDDPDVDPVTYPLTTETTTDQAAYTDAMNQYEFDKSTYDKSIKDINAKIEVIQVEDKNLELRLKQLDTEQDAIQTEMDAVQKVIEKNVESTFKTFG